MSAPLEIHPLGTYKEVGGCKACQLHIAPSLMLPRP